MNVKLLISLLLISAAFICGQPSDSNSQFTRVLNQAGWQVPGLKGAHLKRGTTAHENGHFKDFNYQVTVLVPDAQQAFYPVPMISVDTAGKLIIYKEIKFKPTEIHRFEVAGRPYCYQVSGDVYSENEKTKVGGFAGTIDFLYYD